MNLISTPRGVAERLSTLIDKIQVKGSVVEMDGDEMTVSLLTAKAR